MSGIAEIRLIAIDEATRASAEVAASALDAFLKQSNATPPVVRACLSESNGSDGMQSGVVALPAMMYMHTQHASSVTALAAQGDGCCLMLNVHLDFPFLPALRQRARSVLGNVEMIELPTHKGEDALADADVVAAFTRVVERFRLTSNGAEPPPMASSPRPVAEPEPAPTASAPPVVAKFNAVGENVLNVSSAQQKLKPDVSAPMPVDKETPHSVASGIETSDESDGAFLLDSLAVFFEDDGYDADGGESMPDAPTVALQGVNGCANNVASMSTAAIEGQAAVPMGGDFAEADGEQEYSGRSVIDITVMAEMMDFPLTDVYSKLCEYVPESEAVPDALAGDIRTAANEATALLKLSNSLGDYSMKMVRRLSAVCMLLLAHRARTERRGRVSEYCRRAYSLLRDDKEFFPLSYLGAVVAAEEGVKQDIASAQVVLTKLLRIFMEHDVEGVQPLLFASLLRVYVDVLDLQDGSEDDKRRHTAMFQRVAKNLDSEEMAAIGATAHLKVREAREKMHDVL